MAQPRKNIVSSRKTNLKKPRSIAIADRGITNSREFAELMSALMADLICGAIAPDIGNATCNAGGKLLKIVEMQNKYGKQAANGDRTLELTPSKGD
jgi:hypothetical protein